MTGVVVSLDNNWTNIIEVNGMIGNEYRKLIPDLVYKNYCNELGQTKILYSDIVKSSNLPPQGQDYVCPWPKQQYSIKNYAIDMTSVPQFPFNCKKFKFVFSYLNNETIMMKFAVFLVEE